MRWKRATTIEPTKPPLADEDWHDLQLMTAIRRGDPTWHVAATELYNAHCPSVITDDVRRCGGKARRLEEAWSSVWGKFLEEECDKSQGLNGKTAEDIAALDAERFRRLCHLAASGRLPNRYLDWDRRKARMKYILDVTNPQFRPFRDWWGLRLKSAMRHDKEKQGTTLHSYDTLGGGNVLLDGAIGSSRDLNQVVDSGLLWEQVRKLPPNWQRVIFEVYVNGRTKEETAAVLGFHRNTVARSLKLALAQLKAALAPLFPYLAKAHTDMSVVVAPHTVDISLREILANASADKIVAV